MDSKINNNHSTKKSLIVKIVNFGSKAFLFPKSGMEFTQHGIYILK